MSEAEFNQRLAEQTFVPRVYICISLAIPVFVFAAIVYYIVRTKTKRQDANAKSSVAGKAKGHDAGINAPDIAGKAKSQPGIVDKAKGHDAGIKAPDIADKAKSQPGIVDKAKRQDANAKSSVAGKAKHPDGGAKASKGADKT